MAKFITLLAVAFQMLHVSAECPNACSAHGKCTQFDMCDCYRNWMSNDCSERICQFGLAHVDSPKGDLDASNGALTGPDKVVVMKDAVYPFGTTEQFPDMGDDSSGNPLTNTGHYYMECSNKGLCDRAAGVCECFPGYEGSACQRASCPSGDGGMCSGHGTCHTIREISDMDHENIYELWDKHASMGCVCDAGYYGPSCAERSCKYGIDPLYNDDPASTPRISNWTVSIFTERKATTAKVYGTYSLIFTDVFGEDWETVPIPAGAYCDKVVAALESIPNDVIPLNSVLCLDNINPLNTGNPGHQTLNYDQFRLQTGAPGTLAAGKYDVWRSFILAFPQNPGKLEPLKVNFFLDGPRPTLTTDETVSSLRSLVFADGFSGEFVDYVPDLCEGVKVTIKYVSDGGGAGKDGFFLDGLDFRETAKLKRCLGDSDGNTNQIDYVKDEVYNWDHGDFNHPHLIKLVDVNRNIEVLLCNSTNSYNPYAAGLFPGVVGNHHTSCQWDSPPASICPCGSILLTLEVVLPLDLLLAPSVSSAHKVWVLTPLPPKAGLEVTPLELMLPRMPSFMFSPRKAT